MVGVPGRSKGCHTCKKRRIKCDEQKPECARCLKAGYKCKGYQRDIEFRISTLSPQGASQTASSSRSSTPASEHVPAEISLIAWRPDMQYTFLFRNFVWASYGSPWLQLSAQGKLGVLAQQACSSFSMTTFGRHHHRRDIELEGDTMYGQAVGKVRNGLAAAGPNPALPELLVPILILLIHSSTDPEGGGSQAHVMGLFRLVSLCGPQGFQRRPLRDAYSSCRATLVTVGLLQKRRLFLEDAIWCTIPWALEPKTKTDQDHLVDLLVQVPGLLETQQAIRQAFEPLKQKQMINAVAGHLGFLFSWRQKWESAHPCAAIEVAREHFLSTFVVAPETQRFLRFSCFSTAVEIALYNAVLLCYLGLLFTELTAQQARAVIQQLATNQSEPSSVWSNTALAHPSYSTISLRKAAVEIVRSFEYQLAHVQHCPDAPALFWLFPLGLASKVLEDDVALTEWIQTMLDTSVVTRGYGRGKNAFGFGFYELPKVDEDVGGYHGQVYIS